MRKKLSVYRGIKMARAKYQVLVIPYHVEKENIKYCIFNTALQLLSSIITAKNLLFQQV